MTLPDGSCGLTAKLYKEFIIEEIDLLHHRETGSSHPSPHLFLRNVHLGLILVRAVGAIEDQINNDYATIGLQNKWPAS